MRVRIPHLIFSGRRPVRAGRTRGITACIAAFMVGGAALESGCARPTPTLYETLTLAYSHTPAPPTPQKTRPLETFSSIPSPRAFAYDPERDELLVGVRIGESSSVETEAFVMRLDGEGRLLDPRYLDQIAPGEKLRDLRDLALSEDTLYVLESWRLLLFNRAGGELRRAIPIEGARALHALTLGPNGEVYLADRGLRLGDRGFIPEESDAIYRVEPDGRVHTLAQGNELGRPSGIAFAEDGLWIVSFATGALYRLTDEGEVVDRQTLPAGSLDGIIALPDGRFAIGSWEARGVLVGEKRGEFTVEIRGVEGPAAIAITKPVRDSNASRLFVALPLFDEVRVFEIESHASTLAAQSLSPDAE